MSSREFNFDGLVGPTHHYAGLAPGNLLAERNASSVSSPKQAALQGLAKMRRLRALGLPQGVLPPQERPDIDLLRAVGFEGTEEVVVERVAREHPALMHAVSSASSMWTANAATVSPSADTADGRVHLTPANLVCNLHRWIEAETTTRVLRAIFADTDRFCVHDPLPAHDIFGDEGAANHTRFCASHGAPGVELFTYGRRAPIGISADPGPVPERYPARQTLEASRAIARLHGLNADRTVFVQQHPDVIDQGVFHNDVIAVGNGNVLLYHERAYLDADRMIDSLIGALGEVGVDEFHLVCVHEAELSVNDATSNYLFNSQLVSLEDGSMMLITPSECEGHPGARAALDRILNEPNPISRVEPIDVRQSMRNGGGPACLRLRVVLSEADEAGVTPGCVLTDELDTALVAWVERHYRDELHMSDLADPALLRESRDALDALTSLLGIGSVYPFQRA